jgi:hypothetical protein
MYPCLWYYSLLSPLKDYGGKTHQSDSQNSDTTARSGRELYHLHFSLQVASPETFGYSLVYCSLHLIFWVWHLHCSVQNKLLGHYASSSTKELARWSIILGAGNFSLHHCLQNGSGTHPDSYPMSTRGSFPGVRAAGTWCWPLTSI